MSKTTQQIGDTLITIENDSWKIKVILGLGGLAVLVILAFAYRLEAGLIALAIGGAYAARIGLTVYHQYRLAGFKARHLEAETVKAEAEATKARHNGYFIETNTGVFFLENSEVSINSFYPAVSASKLLADIPQLPASVDTAPRLRRLLDVDFIHMLIVGPTNSGKTTVANWLIENEAPDTLCYVLDPHNKFNVWPGRVSEIIGTGRNYGAIDAKLLDLIGEMDRRYNADALRFSKILIVCDEWLSVLSNCPNAGRFFDTIGSEARKVNMSLIISTTSATADDLNCTAATRDNLVQLSLNRTLKERNQGELKWSRRDTELVELPGPYYRRSPVPMLPPTPGPLAQPVVSTPAENCDLIGFDSGPVAPSPNPDKLRIFRLYQEGKSLNAIWREVHPDRSYGGVQSSELKAVLAEFGVSL